jgi:hypothetical protein
MTHEKQTAIYEQHTGRIFGHWDPQTETVETLKERLDKITNNDPDAIVAMDSLPSSEPPELDDVSHYPVWAVDYRGMALVGDTAEQIEPFADVVEWMNDQ